MMAGLAERLLAGVALIIAIVLGGLSYGSHRYDAGYAKAREEAKLRDDTADITALGVAQKQLHDALTREQALQGEFDDSEAARLKEKEDHEKAVTAVRATERLRCPAIQSADTSDRHAPSANPAPAGGSGATEGTYLVPAATDDILRVAAGITDLVRDYNTVVRYYALARATCNAPPLGEVTLSP